MLDAKRTAYATHYQRPMLVIRRSRLVNGIARLGWANHHGHTAKRRPKSQIALVLEACRRENGISQKERSRSCSSSAHDTARFLTCALHVQFIQLGSNTVQLFISPLRHQNWCTASTIPQSCGWKSVLKVVLSSFPAFLYPSSSTSRCSRPNVAGSHFRSKASNPAVS